MRGASVRSDHPSSWLCGLSTDIADDLILRFILCDREIVLGLEEPGWRNTAPVFPPFELAHWDHMEEIYELTTHGPRRREATLIEIDEDSARPV